jgi:hypothetical protein
MNNDKTMNLQEFYDKILDLNIGTPYIFDYLCGGNYGLKSIQNLKTWTLIYIKCIYKQTNINIRVDIYNSYRDNNYRNDLYTTIGFTVLIYNYLHSPTSMQDILQYLKINRVNNLDGKFPTMCILSNTELDPTWNLRLTIYDYLRVCHKCDRGGDEIGIDINDDFCDIDVIIKDDFM